MTDEPTRKPRMEGIVTAGFCLWCLFWMIQPAVYWAGITECKWLGFPAHYVFWLIGMVVVVPASCFAFTVWANRGGRRPGAPSRPQESKQGGD